MPPGGLGVKGVRGRRQGLSWGCPLNSRGVVVKASACRGARRRDARCWGARCEVLGCAVLGCEVLGCAVLGCEVLGASPKRRPGWDFPPRRRKTASDAAAPQSTSLAHCLRHARLKTAVAAAHDAIMPSVAIFHK